MNEDEFLKRVNQVESWFERHASAIGWAITGFLAAVIIILCRSCS